LLPEWFLPMVGIEISKEARAAFDTAWQAVLPITEALPKTLVLRDFHVDNLMRLQGRDGVAACGLLDFQDAVVGPHLYDVRSLLEDARRDIDPNILEKEKNRYLKSVQDIDYETNLTGWAVLAAQRHTKVIGIFARLQARDNKPQYLGHIPRVWRMLETALNHPYLKPVATWFETHVPKHVRVRP